MAKKEDNKSEVTAMVKNEDNKAEITAMATKEENKDKDIVNKLVCGIIMPISAIGDCSGEHWIKVKQIISEAVESAEYQPKLVSDADDIGIIQQRIIENIYNNDIVVCDVSGKNPNVIFELGMRLAFDKPVIIIIDDKTGYSFDTSPIEHLSYPRDLNYYDILNFKDNLKLKIQSTVEKSKKDSNYSPFLKHFGKFEVAHVEKQPGTINDVVLSNIDRIYYSISRLERLIAEKNISGMENRSISPNDNTNNRIMYLIRLGIQDFSSKQGYSIALIKDLYSSMSEDIMRFLEENNRELCALCKKREILRSYLNIVISQL